MKKQVVLAAALVFASSAPMAMQAQTDRRSGFALQYFVEGPAAGLAGIRMMGIEGVSGQLVTGKPVSATEERHTLQVLGDGTRIDNKQTDHFYRDSEGRTRVERANGAVIIQDRVAGFIAELNTENKTVRRMVFKTPPGQGNAGQGNATEAGPVDLSQARIRADALMNKMTAEIMVKQGPIGIGVPVTAGAVMASPIGGGLSTGGPVVNYSYSVERNEKSQPAPTPESLGVQSINGVTAQGSRTTMTIAMGQIGNDRPIQVVSEQWFSTDLQMLVKSTNSDPRFGETTYQLTNINQAAPDPLLFQIPTDYTSLERR